MESVCTFTGTVGSNPTPSVLERWQSPAYRARLESVSILSDTVGSNPTLSESKLKEVKLIWERKKKNSKRKLKLREKN